MVTHNESSVSPILYNDLDAVFQIIYFFQNQFFASDKFHVTSFRGRPGNTYRYRF
jgi:hypothetical protein